jgi:hypothetical protein
LKILEIPSTTTLAAYPNASPVPVTSLKESNYVSINPPADLLTILSALLNPLKSSLKKCLRKPTKPY